MGFVQRLGSLRSPVSTYANLPITGNILGDLRILTDVGVLYTWMIESSSGSLSDWKKVTVSSYNDLTGRPSSTPLEIDDAQKSIRNVFMNYINILFRKIISQGFKVYKMFDGVFDNFVSETIDYTNSSNVKYLSESRWLNVRTGKPQPRIAPDFGGFDEYTKILAQGGATEFVQNGWSHDLCGNDVWSGLTPVDASMQKFHDSCWHFRGIGYKNDGLFFTDYSVWGRHFMEDVENVDFTIDLWIRFEDISGARPILTQNNFGYISPLISNFVIEKTAADVIRVYYKGDTDVEIEVVGLSELTEDTWYHLAVIRENGYFKIYINGQLDATSLISDNHCIKRMDDPINAVTTFNFGNFYKNPSSYRFQGWMDEIRYSSGIARWTSNFTPPTVAYNTPTQSVPCNNMVLQSEGFESNFIPTSARVVIVLENDGEITPNTDIKAYVSRDGGTTFNQADLVRELEIEPITNILEYTLFYAGAVDLSEQPNGKEIVYKITSHNNKDFRIRYIAVNWK
jgi:hypothetical protein